MATRATLVEAWLADFDGVVLPDVLQHAPLAVHVEVVSLDFEVLADTRVAVSAGLELMLTDSSDSIACSITGTYRLIYAMRPPTNLREQKSFATTRGLLDAWPLWRVWLNTTLAAMGLGPPPLPARLPRDLVGDGEDAFDATKQVKAEVAEQRG